MNAPSNLTPSQIIWARFYSVLHEEVLKLEALAQQKTVESESLDSSADSTATQRQQVKASVKQDSTKQR